MHSVDTFRRFAGRIRPLLPHARNHRVSRHSLLDCTPHQFAGRNVHILLHTRITFVSRCSLLDCAPCRYVSSVCRENARPLALRKKNRCLTALFGRLCTMQVVSSVCRENFRALTCCVRMDEFSRRSLLDHAFRPFAERRLGLLLHERRIIVSRRSLLVGSISLPREGEISCLVQESCCSHGALC